ncbi:glycosyltransferase family 2 protein [Lysinibacillus sp. KU-BSD001]|uniref:glycosyltransferase family 2 protein n=1 Tax=Lysinibacillus sp. KU-BSD001 TaxID=3141328 RepID=UPI0036F0D329
MEDVIVVIPALNPLQSFISFVEQLKKTAVTKIVIVNDGSEEKYAPIFNEFRQDLQCIVIDHLQNKGKGSALKSGFHYILQHEKDIAGVLTVGAHGQHTLSDIQLMLESAKLFSDGIVLGVRHFGSREMPMFSFLGNRAASMLFELLFRRRLLDIQTGLRYIPRSELSWLQKVPGEHFNFDTNMLVEALRRDVPIYEIPIGHAKVRKNSIMNYDEIIDPKKMLQQIWTTFLGNRKV